MEERTCSNIFSQHELQYLSPQTCYWFCSVCSLWGRCSVLFFIFLHFYSQWHTVLSNLLNYKHVFCYIHFQKHNFSTCYIKKCHSSKLLVYILLKIKNRSYSEPDQKDCCFWLICLYCLIWEVLGVRMTSEKHWCCVLAFSVSQDSDRKFFMRFPTGCYSYRCIIPNTSSWCCQLPFS